MAAASDRVVTLFGGTGFLGRRIVRHLPFANAAGWVEVNQNTMQHVRYANVFSLGDVCSTPNSKTAAAVRKQAPVVVRNILRMIAGQAIEPGYDQSVAAEFAGGIAAAMAAGHLPEQDSTLAAAALTGLLVEGSIGPLAPDASGRERDIVQSLTLLALRALGVSDARARGLVVQTKMPTDAGAP